MQRSFSDGLVQLRTFLRIKRRSTRFGKVMKSASRTEESLFASSKTEWKGSWNSAVLPCSRLQIGCRYLEPRACFRTTSVRIESLGADSEKKMPPKSRSRLK